MGNTATDQTLGQGDLEKHTENHERPRVQRERETDLFRAAVEDAQRGVFSVEEGNECPPEPACLVTGSLVNECKLRHFQTS